MLFCTGFIPEKSLTDQIPPSLPGYTYHETANILFFQTKVPGSIGQTTPLWDSFAGLELPYQRDSSDLALGSQTGETVLKTKIICALPQSSYVAGLFKGLSRDNSTSRLEQESEDELIRLSVDCQHGPSPGTSSSNYPLTIENFCQKANASIWRQMKATS